MIRNFLVDKASWARLMCSVEQAGGDPMKREEGLEKPLFIWYLAVPQPISRLYSHPPSLKAMSWVVIVQAVPPSVE